MPSQEDYLDKLLKNLEEKDDAPEDSVGTQPEDSGEDLSLDLDAVSGMTEDEIENLLTVDEKTDEDDFLNASDMDLSDEDVLKMLEDSDDSELQEIQELLEKSDNHETIDDSEDGSEWELSEEKPEADVGGRREAETSDEKPARKGESREEKRERKKAEAAAKKAERQASKEAAKLAKADAKRKKQAKKAAGLTDDIEESEFMDMSLLDSILSEAKMPETDAMPAEKEEEQAEFFDIDAEFDGAEDAAFSEDGGAKEADSPEREAGDAAARDKKQDAENREEEPQSAEAGEKEPQGDGAQEEEPEDDGLGVDIDGLFTDDADGDSIFSDETLALDPDEADKLIPDRDADGEDGEDKGKKPFLSKIKDFLTEDDDENEDLRLSEENQEILNELDNEKGGGKKSGKGGNAAKAKPKKDKDAKQKKQAKPKKPAKQKKPAKAGKEKEPKEPAVGFGKKLSVKKVLPVVLVGVSLGVLLFVFVNAAAEYTDKSNARTAYYQGDYETCYRDLFGKKLDETESIMFGKSESILYIRLWMREYEFWVEEGDELQALDSLIQSVDRYPELYEYANRWNAGSEVAAGYAAILNALEERYGLTESQAKEIASQRNDITYTRMVTAVVEGKSLEKWNEPDAPTAQDTPEEAEDGGMSDPLPEEEELGNGLFIENQ
ncbi:MAG: hypothetical protein NC541_08965 [bacterium]|nr:hypothetical protein [bacterium]